MLTSNSPNDYLNASPTNLPLIHNSALGGGGSNYQQQSALFGGNNSNLVPFVPRSKSILEHLQECKRENNERLKQVRNLDDLVMFKLTTVADKIKQEHAKDGLEVLGLEMFSKICDPLLANSNNYHSLSKKAYMIGKKTTHNQSKLSNINDYSQLTDASSPRSKQINQPQHNIPNFEIASKKDQEVKRKSNVSAAAAGIPTNSLPDDDPVRFLQKYFGNKEGNLSANKKSGKVHPNYMVNKLERQYNQSSKKVENFLSNNVLGLDDYLNSGTSPMLAKHNHHYLNMQSDTQLASQLLSTHEDIPQKVVTSGGASFYSFANNQRASVLDHQLFSQDILENNESLNVLNFNKMKDELQRMFEQDNNSPPSPVAEQPQPPVLLNEKSALQYTPMENQHIQSTQQLDSFQREVQIRTIMRDESAQLHLPQIIHSPKDSTSKREDLNISYSQNKVSFGTHKHRGYSEEPLASYKHNNNQSAMVAVERSKEDKIRQILMNEDPDFLTAERQLNFLSNIAEVRSIGFDRFRYQIINKNGGNNSTMNIAVATSQLNQYTNSGVTARAMNNQSNFKGAVHRRQVNKKEFSQPIISNMSNAQSKLSVADSELMKFNNNRNFEQFQENFLRKKASDFTSENQQIMAVQEELRLPQILPPSSSHEDYNTNIDDIARDSRGRYLSSQQMQQLPISATAEYLQLDEIGAQQISYHNVMPAGKQRNHRDFKTQRVPAANNTDDNNYGGAANNMSKAARLGHNSNDLNSSEDYTHQVEEHFASHQDIRSQLDKIMKVGILSHSDDPTAGPQEVIDEGGMPLPHIPDEMVIMEHPPQALETRDSMQANLQEMANLEKQIELQESINVEQRLLSDVAAAVPQQEQIRAAKATFISKAGGRGQAKHQSRGDREVHPTAEVRIEMHPDYQSSTTKTLMQRDQAAATSMQQFSSVHLSNNALNTVLSDAGGANSPSTHGPGQQAFSIPQNAMKKNTNMNTSAYFKKMKQQMKAQYRQDATAISGASNNPFSSTIGLHQQQEMQQQQQAADSQQQSSYLMLEQFSDEIQNQLIDLAMSKRKAWSPRRFKKFPRFTIFLNRNGQLEGDDQDNSHVKEYLKEHIISLNPEFMNLLLSANSVGEEAAAQIEQALAHINYPDNAADQQQSQQSGYRFQDPFDKVLLTKGIDNQILTSFRTLTKANNVVSDTLKIVHTKFQPMPMSHGQQTKMKKAYGHNLYVINEEVMYGGGPEEDAGEAQGEIVEESENQYDMPLNQIMNVDSSLQQSINLTPGQNKQVASKPKGAMGSHHNKSIVYQNKSQPRSSVSPNHHESRSPERRRSSVEHHELTIGGINTAALISDGGDEKEHLLLTSSIDTAKNRKSKIQVINKHMPQQQPVVLQKIDPSDMFGWSKQPSGIGPQLHATQGGQFQKTLGYHDTYHNTEISGGAPSKWPSYVYGNVLVAPQTVLEENSFNMTRQISLTEQTPPINIAQPPVQQQQSPQQQRQPSTMQVSVQMHKPAMPLKKKPLVAFAGGFQAFNMKQESQQQKLCQLNPHMLPGPVMNQLKGNISQSMIQSSSQENLMAASKQAITGLHSSIPNNITPQQFMESLTDQERIELTKKLINPQASKLKHMIDDLYKKEKKYVKQYLREDYIENNSMMFDLQKSHALQTTKGLQKGQESVARTEPNSFVGGLYSLQMPELQGQRVNQL